MLNTANNYETVYKYAVAILLFIKHYGYNEKLKFQPVNHSKEVLLDALNLIKHYYRMIRLLTNNKDLVADLSFELSEEDTKLSFDKALENIISMEELKVTLEDSKQLHLHPSDLNPIWLEEDLQYSITINNNSQEKVLYDLLLDFTRFKSFREAQLETIIDILNNNDNAICVMPTGSGKSLIYYLVAFLKPKITIVVEPTRILLKDQIYHLEKDYKNLVFFSSPNSELYMEYVPFSRKLLIVTIEQYNSYFFTHKIIDNVSKISHIIIDEIHSLSNFSHNFNPNYLTIAFNIKTFIGAQVRLLSFTATVDDTILNDIKYQLPINKVLSFMAYIKENQMIIVESLSNQNYIEKLVNRVCSIVQANNKFRVLVFSPIDFNDDIERMLVGKHKISTYNPLSHKSNVEVNFEELNDSGYKVILADRVFSVGVDIPSITHVINLFAPLSRIQYVQEIGRSSRTAELIGFNHLLTHMYDHFSNKDREIFDSYDYYILKEKISKCKNDELRIGLKSLLLPDLNHTISKVKEEYEELCQDRHENYIVLERYNDHKTEDFLYHLYRIGVIFNWYKMQKTSTKTDYFIEMNQDFNLSKSIQLVKKYFMSINYFENISDLNNSTNYQDLINKYIRLFYYAYTYHHLEQYRNLLQMIVRNANYPRLLKEEIYEFYKSSVEETEKLTSKIETTDYLRIFDLINDLDKDNYSNLIRISENRQSVKVDFALLIFILINQKQLDATLFKRVSNIFFSDMVVFDKLIELIPEIQRVLAYKLLVDKLDSLELDIRQHSSRLNDFHQTLSIFRSIALLERTAYNNEVK